MSTKRLEFPILVSLLLVAALDSQPSWAAPVGRMCNFLSDAVSSRSSLLRLAEYDRFYRKHSQRSLDSVKQEFFQRIEKGETPVLEEAMAFTDLVAGTKYFQWVLGKNPGLRTSLAFSRPTAKLPNRLSYLTIGWHRTIAEASPIQGRNAIKLRMRYPKDPANFFKSMQILAVHTQTLALANGRFGHSTVSRRFLSRMRGAFLGKTKAEKLRDLATMRTASTQLQKLFIGIQRRYGTSLTARSRFPAMQRRIWVLLLEVFPRTVFPFLDSVSKLPVNRWEIEHLIGDRRQTSALYLRLTGESAFRVYRNAMLVVVTGYFAWSLYDLGMAYWVANLEAEAWAESYHEQESEILSEENLEAWGDPFGTLLDMESSARDYRLEVLTRNKSKLSPAERQELDQLSSEKAAR